MEVIDEHIGVGKYYKKVVVARFTKGSFKRIIDIDSYKQRAFHTVLFLRIAIGMRKSCCLFGCFSKNATLKNRVVHVRQCSFSTGSGCTGFPTTSIGFSEYLSVAMYQL